MQFLQVDWRSFSCGGLVPTPLVKGNLLKKRQKQWISFFASIFRIPLNGLHVNWRGLKCSEFTKTMIFRYFDDILKDRSRYVHLLHYYQTKIQKSPCRTCNRGSKLRCYSPPPINEGLAVLVQTVPLIRNTWTLVSV